MFFTHTVTENWTWPRVFMSVAWQSLYNVPIVLECKYLAVCKDAD
jgi:hypothetical protein